ncbi:hypothetical protein [Streptomyces lydicus]|uniref:hypothetical protein n=1 Tax=Streptomyces lydicus TaxID=47763 RepID=UPI00342C3FA0
MSHRTHRPHLKRRRAHRRFRQGLGQATFYAGSTALAGELVRVLLHLLHLSVSC